MQLRVIFPFKVSTNKYFRMNHHPRSELNNAIYLTTLDAVRKEKLESITTFLIKMRYTFFQNGTLLDASNCSGMAKALEDGLVKAGVMPDDNPRYVKGIEINSERNKTKGMPYCIIETYE